MRRRFLQLWMTLSDLECLKATSSASCTISAVAELLVNYHSSYHIVYNCRQDKQAIRQADPSLITKRLPVLKLPLIL